MGDLNISRIVLHIRFSVQCWFTRLKYCRTSQKQTEGNGTGFSLTVIEGPPRSCLSVVAERTNTCSADNAAISKTSRNPPLEGQCVFSVKILEDERSMAR